MQQAMWVDTEFQKTPNSDVFRFPRPIERVAVIGAGIAGLQAAAVLQRQNLNVKLFERSVQPGGVWNYQRETKQFAPRESVPQRPIPVRGYFPDIPPSLPFERTWKIQDVGERELREKWAEHILPSPLYDHLSSSSPAPIMHLPELNHSPDAPWQLPHNLLQRHVRAFASLHQLNTTDDPIPGESSTSYSTRIESASKIGNEWRLILRQLRWSEDGSSLKARYWQETFDAILVATGTYEAPHIPVIEGLDQWWKIRENDGTYPVSHAREYTNPEFFKDKTVLIVGAAVSGSEIGLAVGPLSKALHVSAKDHDDPLAKALLKKFPADTTFHKEIQKFESLPSGSTSIHKGTIVFADGTKVSGIDAIIFATGYRRSLPFLPQFHGTHSTSIIDDGLNLKLLHWTGHYIYDPTLAFTWGSGWFHGHYQAEVFTKVWEGSAFLPSQKQMLKEYEGPRGQPPPGGLNGEDTSPFQVLTRKYVNWINENSARTGGRLVDGPPLWQKQVLAHFLLGKYPGLTNGKIGFSEDKAPSEDELVEIFHKLQERY